MRALSQTEGPERLYDERTTMAIRLILLLLGVFHLVNGLWMVVSPHGWYAGIPGVSMTGPSNDHFIADIGLAFIASGIGMVMGFAARTINAAFALAGSVWPMLHALLHIWVWIGH